MNLDDILNSTSASCLEDDHSACQDLDDDGCGCDCHVLCTACKRPITEHTVEEYDAHSYEVLKALGIGT